MVTATNPAPTKLARRYAALAFVLLGVLATVVVVSSLANERIARNERAWFVAHLDALIPPILHDNDLFADVVSVHAPDLLGAEATTIYRARKNGNPVGAIIATTAPEGYGGDIHLLVAIDVAGNVLGVDILSHNETQGIGDGFAPHRSDWLTRLIGKSLSNPQPKQWTIHKDGGEFDQFTGASVTPRAILKAVRQTLEYSATHRVEMYR
jgi:Na+-translocating ferredoxin:NAD+ oxidoreductase subunit G